MPTVFEINAKPVSVNRMTLGKKILTREYRDFRDWSIMQLVFQKSKLRHITDKNKEMVVSVHFELTNAKSIDIDGCVKGVLDACTYAGIWEDDRYITKLILTKEKKKENRVVITIL